MKTDYSFNSRQLLSLAAVFFLAPALRLVPGSTAATAGRAAWISVLAALPLLLGYAWFLSRLLECRQEEESLAQLILRALGPGPGRAALGIFAFWFILYGGFMLRSGADRIIVTIYPNSSSPIFVLPMGLLGLAAALGAGRTLVRAAKILLPPVIGALVLVLLFASFSVSRENLLPLTIFQTPETLLASLATVDVVVLPLYICLFLPRLRSGGKSLFLPLGLWMLSVVLLLFWLNTDIVGCFGSELTGKLSQPFFVLVRNLVFFRSLERVEALVVTLWIFSDFALISCCLYCAQHSLRIMLGKRGLYQGEGRLDFSDGRWLIWLCAAAAIVFALLVAPDPPGFHFWSGTLIPIANLCVAFILLPAIYIIGKKKKTL